MHLAEIFIYFLTAILAEEYGTSVNLLHIEDDGALYAIEDNRTISMSSIKHILLDRLELLKDVRPAVLSGQSVYSTHEPYIVEDVLYCNTLDEVYPRVTKELKEQIRSFIGKLTVKKKSRSMRFLILFEE